MTAIISRRLAAAGTLAFAALAAAAPAPAPAIGGAEDRGMVGGGWVAAGDRSKVHVGLDLPCAGAEAGFNPQPDPPGSDRTRLTVSVGEQRFHLDEITSSACTIGKVESRLVATHEGSGVAGCGGERGLVITWRFTDAGIGGRDTAEVGIGGPGATAACANDLHIAGPLGGGNLDSQRRG